jgi:phage terminase small subunit
MPRVTSNRSPRRRDARRHSEADVVLLHGEARVPDPDESWSDVKKAEWEAYWRSDVAKLATEETVPVAYRLHDRRDEARVLLAGLRKSGARLTLGSEKQVRANPIYKVLQGLDAEIRQLEDRLGLSPLAKLQLGATFGSAASALDDLNRRFEAEVSEDDDATEPDPRVTDIGQR